MIKICFITTLYGTYRAFLRNFAAYLYKSGQFDISLICNTDERIRDELPGYIHFYPVLMTRGISLSAVRSIYSIKRILKKKQFDIVQYSTPNAAFYASIAAKAEKVPVRLYCQWGIRYMGFSGILRKIFKIFEKIVCSNSSYIEAESFNIHKFSLEENLYKKNKSCVVWNGSASGVDLRKFDVTEKNKWRQELRDNLNFDESDIVFCFAGRLTADKGVNELLEAFLNINKHIDDIKLVILGSMDNRQSLQLDLWEAAKSNQNIIFAGRVDDIEKYYACADVFVAPSYREGFGLVVVEAEAMGLPAIVSNVPGQKDAILEGVTGLLCTVKSSVSLQEAMEKLINNEGLRMDMGKEAVKFAINNYEQNELFRRLKENRIRLKEREN